MGKTIRQLQKEQTKESLLKTAYEYFSEHGILNTRMSDIAQAAGVSHGTVFLHFKSQEALITEVVETYCGKIAARTHELADSRVSVQDILSAHLAGIAEFEPFYTRLVIENRLLPLPARDAWINAQSAISFHFGKAVERERKAGALTEVPAYLLFNMWIGLVHYYLANSDLFAPDGSVIERYGKILVSNYMKMIRHEIGDK
jgi:Transcriptional regulator